MYCFDREGEGKVHNKIVVSSKWKFEHINCKHEEVALICFLDTHTTFSFVEHSLSFCAFKLDGSMSALFHVFANFQSIFKLEARQHVQRRELYFYCSKVVKCYTPPSHFFTLFFLSIYHRILLCPSSPTNMHSSPLLGKNKFFVFCKTQCRFTYICINVTHAIWLFSFLNFFSILAASTKKFVWISSTIIFQSISYFKKLNASTKVPESYSSNTFKYSEWRWRTFYWSKIFKCTIFRTDILLVYNLEEHDYVLVFGIYLVLSLIDFSRISDIPNSYFLSFRFLSVTLCK